MSKELVQAIVEMREDDAHKLAEDLLEAGKDPLVVLDSCREAMDIVGGQFDRGEVFVPELILAGEMLSDISAAIKPYMAEDVKTQTLGKIVFGTVEGDIHDIAKDIVVFMLDINGFEVKDLGVDVPPAKFVETVRETGATIVGLSGVLTLAYDPMKATVKALREAGFDDVKVMVGGGQVDEHICEYTDADGWGCDAMAAVALAKSWV